MHDMPHIFSYMQSWHILKPHLHCQQKGGFLPQQWHLFSFALRRFSLYEDSLRAEAVMFHHYTSVHHNINTKLHPEKLGLNAKRRTAPKGSETIKIGYNYLCLCVYKPSYYLKRMGKGKLFVLIEK